MAVKLGTNKWVAGDQVSAQDINDTFLAASGAKIAVAGENISALKPTYLHNADSKLYTAHGFKEIQSYSFSLSVSTTKRTNKLSDTQFIILTHSGSTLTVGVYSIASGSSVASATVTTSYDTTAISTTLPGATVCRLSDTTFVVFYVKTSNSNFYFRTGSISGGTITMDTETVFTGSPDYCFGFDSVPGASNGKVVLTYFDGGSDPGSSSTTWNTHLSYLTVATNSVTVDTDTTYAVTSSSYFATPRWSVCCFTDGIAYGLFSCGDGEGNNRIEYNYINTADNSTGTRIQTLNLESPTGTGVASVYSAIIPYLVGHNGKGYFGYATTTNTSGFTNTKTVLEISQIGCKNFYTHTTVRLGGDTTVEALPMFGNECGVIVCNFPNATFGSDKKATIYIQRDKVYGFYDMSTLAITTQPDGFYINLKDEIVVVSFGNYVKTWRMATPFDGFAPEAITSGNTGIASNGQLTTSGLTANAPYFLKDTYSAVGDIDFKGVISIGRSLSTTQLMQKL